MKDEDKEYLQQLNKAYLESSAQFDKQLLYFASGALGLSFVFIKDIVKLNVATCKNLLITSWSFFGAVIVLSILSHYSSLKAINKKIQNVNWQDESSSKLNSYTKAFNILMIIFLISGLVILTVFIGINI